MSSEAIVKRPRIVKNGGPITSDTYRSHTAELWQAGALLHFESGLLAPAVNTAAGHAVLDLDDTGTTVRLFIALEDHLTAGTVFVAVQEILNDTVLEVPLIASSTTAPTTANITTGQTAAGYQITGLSISIDGTSYNIAGRPFGVDVDGAADSKVIFSVVDKATVFNPYDPDSDDNYATVYVRLISTVLA